MEIIVAMFLTILKTLTYAIETVVALAVLGIIMTVLGLAAIKHHAWRTQKDVTSTDEGDFEESYVPQPGKRLITSTESARMWRELDRLNDEAVLENTKDL